MTTHEQAMQQARDAADRAREAAANLRQAQAAYNETAERVAQLHRMVATHHDTTS